MIVRATMRDILPGATGRPMKVLLFSDLHYSLDRTIHGRRPEEALSQAITHAKRHHSDANLCIVLGDLAERGLASEYRSLAADLEIMSIPYRTLLGNHDNRDEYIRVFGADIIDDNGFVHSTIDAGPYRFIFLDRHRSKISQRIKLWLE